MLTIHSRPPHDFYLTLDASNYFEAEDEAEEIYHGGYAKPLSLSGRDVLAVVRWNEDPDDPVFEVDFPDQDPLSEEELAEADRLLRRVLGADLDLAPLMEQAADDPLLGPLMEEHWGFKRIAGQGVWEDAVSDIIRTRISHEPTAKRMVQDVRRTWGTGFEWRGRTYWSYPRPEALEGVEPEAFREFGISGRKAEYVLGLAELYRDGELDDVSLEAMAPMAFYERIQKVRGIGPSTAQSLMHFRARPDAVFPSHQIKGREKGLRRWFIRSYGADPDQTSEEEFLELIAAWRGYESLAMRFLYYDYLMREKTR